MPRVTFPEGRRIVPGFSPELFKHNFAKTVAQAPRPSYSELTLRNFASSQEEYTVVQYWMATRQDINAITSAAVLAHGQGPGLPNILELGAGSLFLSGLLARAEQATVTAVEPFKPLTEASPYAHHFLKVVNADAEWATRNFPEGEEREIDLLIWSWPIFGAEPFKMVERLGAKALLFAYSPEHSGYRRTNNYASDDSVVHEYLLNFDRVPGWRKAALWTSPDHQDIYNYQHYTRPLAMSNQLVLYIREGIALNVGQIEKAPNAEQYPWVEELETLAKKRGGRLPVFGEVKPIDESYLLCPREEELLFD